MFSSFGVFFDFDCSCICLSFLLCSCYGIVVLLCSLVFFYFVCVMFVICLTFHLDGYGELLGV